MGSRPRRRLMPSWLPHGGTLPPEVWAVRHRWVVTVLAVQVPLVVAFGLARGIDTGLVLTQALPLVIAVLIALLPSLPRRVRAVVAGTGLMLVSAVVVQLSGGAIEGHFHFFVMIPVVALYEDWAPFGVACGYVLFHHGIVGTFASHAVYNHMDAHMHPWRWAAIHAVAFGAACVGSIVSWKLHERARAEQDLLTAELARQAFQDPLTGLPNRTALAQRGRATLDACRIAREPASVLLIDLDRFKEVNDTLGHAAGDALLCQVADRLRQQIRPEDLLARLGGDEFALVLPGRSTMEARGVARQIRSALYGVFGVDGVRVDADASTGVSGVRADGSLVGDRAGQPPQLTEEGVLSELLRRADVAMYVAKHGGSAVAVYTREEDANDRSRLALVADLRRQLSESSMELFHQPKLDLRTGTIAGVEGLVRWKHRERGLLLPVDFIAAAETSGLIEPLTVQVIELALAQVVRWKQVGLHVPVAVNISPSCLGMDLPSIVRESLETYGVDASMLRMEITEDTLMADPDHAVNTLRQLRDLGIALSIDDFGSGYAGLSYLRRLPVDELKLDRQFTVCLDQHDVPAEDPDVLIVRSTVELGRSLGLTVVAEGVETPQALEALAMMGCDQVQGYLVARPMPADLATRWLLAHQHEPAVSLPQPRRPGLVGRRGAHERARPRV